MDQTLDLGYATGSAVLITILIAIFVLWRLSGTSFSVDSIHTFKAELFCWVTILLSNTLGTALGDYLADDSGLGFAGRALLIGSIIGVIVLAHFFTRLSTILLFWMAFILTRPFGATLGDFLTKAHNKGGLDLGTVGSSAILGAALVILVIGACVAQNLRARQNALPAAL